MRRSFSTQTQIVGEIINDDVGNLVAQQVFKVTTARGSAGSIHRTVKQIIRFKDTNKNQFKEVVCAEAMVIFPDIAEAELLIKHLVGDIKECLSINREDDLDEKILEEQIQIPAMV